MNLQERQTPRLGHGDPALLLIRPTGLRLSSLGDLHLLGAVTDAAFRGRGYE